jgi:hypothetical protein
MAEEIPTNKFGAEAAKAMIKKAITNSRQPKNLATLIKAKTKKLPDQKRIKQEKIKMKIYKIIISF